MSTDIQTNPLTAGLIQKISKTIVEDLNPQQILIFGSRATGSSTPNSDLDLFIVNDTKHSNRTVRRRIDNLLADRVYAVDILVRTPQEIKQNLSENNPFYHNLFQSAIMLYDKGK